MLNARDVPKPVQVKLDNDYEMISNLIRQKEIAKTR